MKANCQKVIAQLAALQDNELGSDEERAIREHVASCSCCRQMMAGLAAVDGGLSADAAWQPPAGGLVSAVMRAAEARIRARPSRVSRTLRFAMPLAAAAAILVLAAVVVGRLAGRPAAPVPHMFVVAPRVVVERLPAAAPSPPPPPLASVPTPAVAVRSSADMKPFQLGAVSGPVGRAFVIRDGQPRVYEGMVSVTLDPMPFGPPALRVDAFPRERSAALRWLWTKRL